MIVYVDDITRNMFTVIDGVMVCGRFRPMVYLPEGPLRVRPALDDAPSGGWLWGDCEMVERRWTCWKNGWGRWRSDDEARAWAALERAGVWFETEQRAKCG